LPAASAFRSWSRIHMYTLYISHNIHLYITLPVYIHKTMTWKILPAATTLLHTATHCNTLLYTAAHFNTTWKRQCIHVGTRIEINCNILQHTSAHCNTLQHTATHCNTLLHFAAHCNTLQHTATHCNTLQHTASFCSTLQHTVAQPERGGAYTLVVAKEENKEVCHDWNHYEPQISSAPIYSYIYVQKKSCKKLKKKSWRQLKSLRATDLLCVNLSVHMCVWIENMYTRNAYLHISKCIYVCMYVLKLLQAIDLLCINLYIFIFVCIEKYIYAGCVYLYVLK